MLKDLRLARDAADNAGVTMDKKLTNQTPERFGKVLEINLLAPELITDELLYRELRDRFGESVRA